MSWAARKRAQYLGAMIVIILAFLAWAGFRLLYEAPSCTDGLHNGKEQGVDCGGSCERICSFQAQEPLVLWNRFFEVTPGFYSTVALVQNPNVDVHAFDVPYIFKLRDERGILIEERKGSVYLPPQTTFAIFESAFTVGGRVPANSFFEFLGTIDWKRTAASQPDLRVGNIDVMNPETAPRISVILSNPGLHDVMGIYVVAVVLNEEGNALGTSQTVVDLLRGETSRELVFTWPQGFAEVVAKVDVFPVVPL